MPPASFATLIPEIESKCQAKHKQGSKEPDPLSMFQPYDAALRRG